MRKPVAALVLGLWIGGPLFGAHASQAGGSPITKDRLAGTWEGLTRDELRVFLVVVVESGTTAAIGIGMRNGSQDILRFSISKTTVVDGNVHWEGASEDPERKYRVDIQGQGKEFQGAGQITADWRLLGPKGDVKASWSVRLVGRDGAHIERIANLAAATRQRLGITRPR